MYLSSTARFTAALIAIAALAAQVTQTVLDMSEGMGLFESLWRQARYFTVLMVVTTGILMAAMTIRGRMSSTGTLTAVTVWIVMVGLVYHALLAATHHPAGIEVTINEIQHTAVPITMLLFWLGFAPKAGLTFVQPLVWVACPLVYAVYAIARGLADGTFPYFFLNPDKTGWIGVGAYLIGLGALFYLAGALLVFVAQKLAAR
jgi:hypothetical protein